MEDSRKVINIPNPREKANLLSRCTFVYIYKLFLLGYRKIINEDDLYEIDSAFKSSTLGNKAIEIWKREVKFASENRRQPSLRKLIFKLCLKRYLLIGTGVFICELVLKPLQAIALGEFILCYTDPREDRVPYIYALCVMACVFTNAIVGHPMIHASFRLSFKIRVFCSSLIYWKILRLSTNTLNQRTPGEILNLISNDVNVFDRMIYTSQFIWAGPVQAILITALMYKEVGVSAIFGVALLLGFIPLYILLGKLVSKYRLKASAMRDQRLRCMNEVIKGIAVIKMYAWEESFSKIIYKLRNMEIHFTRLGLYIRSATFIYDVFVSTALFITITSGVLLNQNFNPKSVFIVTTLISILAVTLNFFVPQGMIFVSEIFVSIRRISDFLLSHELESEGKSNSTWKVGSMVVQNGASKWDPSSAQYFLRDLNFEIKPGSLNAVVGSIASGKTSLLNVLLGEMALVAGTVNVSGCISYAPQVAWIFSATIRQNILFGSEMDVSRYNKVINCCALERDIKLFPNGDQTVVGERGASLSGGQKARINLARAIYRKADIYLLDDPLSAVDTEVGKQMFEQCIQTFLKDKTIVLVTHQLQYLKHVDSIIVLDKGTIINNGTTSELEKSGFDFVRFLQDHDIDKVDETVAEDTTRSQSDNVTATVKPQNISLSTGMITLRTYKDYFFASKSFLVLTIPVLLFILVQLAMSSSFYFLAYWVKIEHQFGILADQRNVYIYAYCIITGASLIFTILRAVSFVHLAITSSQVLHKRMFKNVLRATINFFNTNSSGVILNRFAKDLATIDELLPTAVMIAARTALSILGIFCVICFVNPWFVIPTLIVVATLHFLRKFYLATSLNVLRTEGQVRGPLYGYVNASLHGLTTIRAFGVQEILTQEFNRYQDVHTSALDMAATVSRAFAYCMDLLNVCYVIVLTTYYAFHADPNGGNMGLIISQALQLMSQLPWGVRQATDAENFMVSVERVVECDLIEKEESGKNSSGKRPPNSWPYRGQIEFKNVYLKYSENSPYALNNLNISIRSMEKIGIVGRTGAGKSSIIAALFQLVKTEGEIEIDNINICGVCLLDLRRKMSIIPQDPILFTGSVRSNLDPFGQYEDELLWKALEEVRLKDVVHNLPSGLDFEISQDGSNFSVGQRQLICLARAIIRHNKILILDEATANVDVETDALIQETIRTTFSNCTVLTVAHRLNTIIDSDKVLVMDMGVGVEFDHPHLLLQRKDGVFYNLVQQTGKVMADALADMAKKNYLRL